MRPISNLNSVYIKNSGPHSETLAIIRELTKLGIIKSKAKKDRKQSVSDIPKQESDMVGYVKNLGGMDRGGQFPLRLLPNTATPQQIEDFNRINSARIAALQGEIAQSNRETQQTIGGLAGAASQRFANIQNVLGQIVNPATERFRGSTFPASAQGDEPVDPFYYARGGRVPQKTILLPDTTDVPMDQTLNEGGPETTANISQTLYAPEEESNVGISSSEMGEEEEGQTRIMPQQKIGGGAVRPRQTIMTRREFLKENGLEPIPSNTKSTTLQEMYDYYVDFSAELGYPVREQIRYNKSEMYREMVSIIDDSIKSIQINL